MHLELLSFFGILHGSSGRTHILNSIVEALNAYEFERHSGAKSKHPNNHIYFDNGKSIYSVVQELKNTPQEMLFDVIQNVTGATINQKNFRTWKGNGYFPLCSVVAKKTENQAEQHILTLIVMHDYKYCTDSSIYH